MLLQMLTVGKDVPVGELSSDRVPAEQSSHIGTKHQSVQNPIVPVCGEQKSSANSTEDLFILSFTCPRIYGVFWTEIPINSY